MKLGLSSYSLSRAIRDERLSVVDAVRWIADHGGEHVEIVPIAFDLKQNPELIDAIVGAAKDAGIEISNYAVPANFVTDSDAAYTKAIEGVKEDVDIANRLGVKLMRHDVASRPIEQATIANFEHDLPMIAAACQEIADYAAQYGITTSVENHGYYVQAADRVQRLLQAVNRPNFKTTLDIGNFMCADETPTVSVQKNLPYASIVHLKDFYLRPSYANLGEGWFRSAGGSYLRGAITGYGDIDMREVLRIIKQSGYDGYISIEFEGQEDCLLGSRISLQNVKKIWDEI